MNIRRSLIVISLFTFILVACSNDGYNVDSLVGGYVDSDPQHRIFTIEGFKGTLEQSIAMGRTSLITIDIEGTDDPFTVKLISPNESVLLNVSYTGEAISDSIEGDFPDGGYILVFEAKKLDFAEIKVDFND